MSQMFCVVQGECLFFGDFLAPGGTDFTGCGVGFSIIFFFAGKGDHERCFWGREI